MELPVDAAGDVLLQCRRVGRDLKTESSVVSAKRQYSGKPTVVRPFGVAKSQKTGAMTVCAVVVAAEVDERMKVGSPSRACPSGTVKLGKVHHVLEHAVRLEAPDERRSRFVPRSGLCECR